MTIKVNPDGSFEVNTVDEALELQRRIRGQPLIPPRPRQTQAVNGHEHDYGHEIFKKLKPHNGQEIDSATMQEIIDSKTTGGVGPKLYHMKNRIPGLANVLQERKDERGHTFWRVKLP
jgi:hypothetical protein